MVTFALETTAPCGSSTCPRKVPVARCANAKLANRVITIKVRAKTAEHRCRLATHVAVDFSTFICSPSFSDSLNTGLRESVGCFVLSCDRLQRHRMKGHPARQSSYAHRTLCLHQFCRGAELNSSRQMNFRIFEARKIPKDHMI